MHKEKVDVIVALQTPRNTSELQTFLGMIVYFSNYIPLPAWIISTSFKLLKKNFKWVWTETEQEVFEPCKRAMQSTPVPVYAQSFKGCHLYDARDYAVGAVLQ
jgi:hypothetical protein